MRAPPLAEKHTSGKWFARQCSAARTKRSPTTEPIEPPRKRNSNAQATSTRPLHRADHDDQRVLFARVLLRGNQPVAVLLGVAEPQRILGLDLDRDLVRRALVEKSRPAGRGPSIRMW